MHIKQPTVLPAGVKITKCAPQVGSGKSVYSLLRAEEKRLEREANLKQVAQNVTALIKAGYTVLEAIELAQK